MSYGVSRVLRIGRLSSLAFCAADLELVDEDDVEEDVEEDEDMMEEDDRDELLDDLDSVPVPDCSDCLCSLASLYLML